MKKLFILLLLAIVMGLSACSTGVVPPGTIVIKVPTEGEAEIITSGKYTAIGRDRIYFLDTKMKSFSEHMEILCDDKVNIKVDVKWLGSFGTNESDIKKILEKVEASEMQYNEKTIYKLSLSSFYNTAMADIVRSNSRMVVSPYVTEAVQEKRDIVEAEIKKRILDRFNTMELPIVSTDIMISNLDFDDVITAQRQAIKSAELEDEKQAALAKAAVAQAQRNEELAIENGKATIADAEVKAASNKILSESITANILAMRQWDVLEQAALSQNNQTWVMPYEALSSTDMLTNLSITQ